jgi:ubiquitin carboxyl-terminal hydrolase 36/42
LTTCRNYSIEDYRRICETSIIHQIFGAHLRSQVKCASCHHESNTTDPFLDLSLEIKGSTLDQCLAAFTAPEKLDCDNQYKCEKCHKQTSATKRFTIQTAPYILTVQFKRFKMATTNFYFGAFFFFFCWSYRKLFILSPRSLTIGFPGGSRKISKHISFPDKLKLGKYMSHGDSKAAQSTYDGPPTMALCTEPAVYSYTLYGVVVHSGGSLSSGHYYSYVKVPTTFAVPQLADPFRAMCRALTVPGTSLTTK